MLAVNQKAPEFTLPNQEGLLVLLSDYIGKKVVVYFYVKNNTPACTQEACGFRDLYHLYEQNNIQVIGISVDKVRSHVHFYRLNQLQYQLLSDPAGDTMKLYDLWHDKKSFGYEYQGTIRTTFLIDEEGIITKIYPKPKSRNHAAQILMDLGIEVS